MLSIPSTHIVAAVLLAGFLPGAKANCWDGDETCQGLSNEGFIIILIVACTYYRISPHHNSPALPPLINYTY
ncbi:hypothetical protein F5888DRAFT_1745461 [Russula emetica]|nr:hypothetical protein F5888DRAFT_1745461 [Russula emetica]